jgi:hypothetical protein
LTELLGDPDRFGLQVDRNLNKIISVSEVASIFLATIGKRHVWCATPEVERVTKVKAEGTADVGIKWQLAKLIVAEPCCCL